MKCGTVALIGKPNVGKSSLINAILKTHALIISPKPQTTRNSIRCIYNDNDSQIIFNDTPGFYNVTSSKDKLGIFLNDEINEALEYSDVVLWIVDAGTKKLQPDDFNMAEILSASKTKLPVILIANKSDVANSENAFKLYDEIYKFHEKFSVSAKFKHGIDELINALKLIIPEGEPIYDPEILMDTTEKFVASEIIREKILMLFRDEVPHCVAVNIEEYKSPEEFPERSGRKLYIRASLIVETEGQKKILIGSNGNMIKKIGALSRKSIEDVTGLPVFLELWVKVVEGWRKNQAALKRYIK